MRSNKRTARPETSEAPPRPDTITVTRCRVCRYCEVSGPYGECGLGLLGIVSPWDGCSRGVKEEETEK